MIQTILVTAAFVAFVYSWRRKRAEDADAHWSTTQSQPPVECECAPLSDDEWIAAEADRILLHAFIDLEIARTLEEGL